MRSAIALCFWWLASSSSGTPPQPALLVWPAPKSIFKAQEKERNESTVSTEFFAEKFRPDFNLEAAGRIVSEDDVKFVAEVAGLDSAAGHLITVTVTAMASVPDEGYQLVCAAMLCHLTVSSRTGFLYGVMSLAQVLHNEVNPLSLLRKGFTISDHPSFAHRGMLIDTGRRFLSVDLIKRNLFLMAWVKMNVLHWHLSDDVSFSLLLDKYPGLQEGNPSPERYSAEEIRDLVALASKLGIKIIPEIDVPAHTMSWLRGYPKLKGNASYWMDPISAETRDMVVSVVTDVVEIFYQNDDGEAVNGERMIHLGGDEIGDAWDTPELNAWLREHGTFNNITDLVNYWISHAVADVKQATGAKVTLWNDFLDLQTTETEVIDSWQIWLYDTQKTLEMAESGKFKSLLYSKDFYLDNLGMDWTNFYDVPLKKDEGGVIKGGEACMWGESVDDSVFMPRVWPRAAAVAERLWCAECPTEHRWAVNRLARTRCFLSAVALGHSNPSEIAPIGNYQDLSNPDSSYIFHLDGDQWWCREWASPSVEEK